MNFRAALIFLSAIAATSAAGQEAEPISGAPSVSLAEAVQTTDTLVPFRCPIEQIRTAYQNLVDPDDALMALAIEKQTLAICRQSQEALIRIAENEMRLRELFLPILAPAEPVEAEAEPQPVVDPEPFLPAFDPDTPAPAEPVQTESEYTLEVLMRDPQGAKAMLRKGEEIHTVRSGDRLEDGTEINAVSSDRVEITSPEGKIFVLE